MGAQRGLTDTWRPKQGFPKENAPKGWPKVPGHVMWRLPFQTGPRAQGGDVAGREGA